MSKVKTTFICDNCGSNFPKWQGQCTSCKSWNSITEEVILKSKINTWESESVKKITSSFPQKISNIVYKEEDRLVTSDTEFNRVLGGGIVPGSLILLGGEPGIGKSTLLNIIKMIFKHELKKEILSINLDNFYYDKEYRIKLAKRIHPLLKTRGVPGTHNIKQIDKTVNSFVKSKYPIKIPIFDKLTDKKLKKNIIVKKKCKILILEGWCVGCPPINLKYFLKLIFTPL